MQTKIVAYTHDGKPLLASPAADAVAAAKLSVGDRVAVNGYPGTGTLRSLRDGAALVMIPGTGMVKVPARSVRQVTPQVARA
jgi:hypothetical protein